MEIEKRLVGIIYLIRIIDMNKSNRRMDCIDIIEIVISLDCVLADLYDLVILFKYIIVMMN